MEKQNEINHLKFLVLGTPRRNLSESCLKTALYKMKQGNNTSKCDSQLSQHKRNNSDTHSLDHLEVHRPAWSSDDDDGYESDGGYETSTEIPMRPSRLSQRRRLSLCDTRRISYKKKKSCRKILHHRRVNHPETNQQKRRIDMILSNAFKSLTF